VVRVIYLDRGSGKFRIRACGGAFKRALTGSGRWQTAEFEVKAAKFTAGEAHASIGAGAELTLHMIEVERRFGR
jgi:hypothetical protein